MNISNLGRAAVVLALMTSCSSPDRDEGQDDPGGPGLDGGENPSDPDDGSGDNGNDGNDDAIFDVGTGDGGGDDGGGCADGDDEGEVEFTYIWIANSPQGTVSKIDTRTGVEVGRYYTGPAMNSEDDPSRTSVNLIGDVAISNRGGGITKIGAIEDHCVDVDADGVITTSTGPNDVLPWGEDECVLWHRPIAIDPPTLGAPYPHHQGPRPTAWDAGAGNTRCDASDDRVWTGWLSDADNTAFFLRLRGSDGEILDAVQVPDWRGPSQSIPYYGPYGGAVDREGNFWVTGLTGPLVRFDAENPRDWKRWEPPQGTQPYGIAIGADGNVWLSNLSGEVLRFDVENEVFATIMVGSGDALRGLQIDRDGFAWVAGNAPCRLVKVSTQSLQVVNDAILLPGCQTPVGVSIDVDGYVWVPDQTANLVYKVHPDTFSTTTTEGLQGPYTYSDMTGAGLKLVTDPPV